jgi:hypothetical protein
MRTFLLDQPEKKGRHIRNIHITRNLVDEPIRLNGLSLF